MECNGLLIRHGVIIMHEFKSGRSDTVNKLKNPSIFRGVFYYKGFHAYSNLSNNEQWARQIGRYNIRQTLILIYFFKILRRFVLNSLYGENTTNNYY